MSKKSCNFANKIETNTIMEDVIIRMPSADVAMIMQFASRMGWTIENLPNPYTWDEARNRLSIAQTQFANGQYKSHEEVMQPRKKEAL